MAKSKLPKRMFKGAERASRYIHDRSKRARIKKIARDHEHVLQDIEGVLISSEQEDPRIDDAIASLALRSRMANIAPEDDLAAGLFEELQAVRIAHEDLSDFDWIETLRVVDESVKLHSGRTPGEKLYLRFAAKYFTE